MEAVDYKGKIPDVPFHKRENKAVSLQVLRKLLNRQGIHLALGFSSEIPLNACHSPQRLRYASSCDPPTHLSPIPGRGPQGMGGGDASRMNWGERMDRFSPTRVKHPVSL